MTELKILPLRRRGCCQRTGSRPSAGIGGRHQTTATFSTFQHALGVVDFNICGDRAACRIAPARFLLLLLLASWSLEVVSWFARLHSYLRGCGLDPRQVRGKIAALKTNVEREAFSRSLGWEIATLPRNIATCTKKLARNTHGEQLADLRRATCAEQPAKNILHTEFAQGNLHKATCVQAHRDRRADLRRATCTEQIAYTVLRAASWSARLHSLLILAKLHLHSARPADSSANYVEHTYVSGLVIIAAEGSLTKYGVNMLSGHSSSIF